MTIQTVLLAVKNTAETIQEGDGGIRYLTSADFSGGGGGGGSGSGANYAISQYILTDSTNGLTKGASLLRIDTITAGQVSATSWYSPADGGPFVPSDLNDLQLNSDLAEVNIANLLSDLMRVADLDTKTSILANLADQRGIPSLAMLYALDSSNNATVLHSNSTGALNVAIQPTAKQTQANGSLTNFALHDVGTWMDVSNSNAIRLSVTLNTSTTAPVFQLQLANSEAVAWDDQVIFTDTTTLQSAQYEKHSIMIATGGYKYARWVCVSAGSATSSQIDLEELDTLNQLIYAAIKDMVNSQTMNETASPVVAIGATSAQSPAFNASTKRIVLSATDDCWYAIGANPTAVIGSSGSKFIKAGVPQYPMTVTAGHKVAVIGTTGYLSILESS